MPAACGPRTVHRRLGAAQASMDQSQRPAHGRPMNLHAGSLLHDQTQQLLGPCRTGKAVVLRAAVDDAVQLGQKGLIQFALAIVFPPVDQPRYPLLAKPTQYPIYPGYRTSQDLGNQPPRAATPSQQNHLASLEQPLISGFATQSAQANLDPVFQADDHPWHRDASADDPSSDLFTLQSLFSLICWLAPPHYPRTNLYESRTVV